MYRLEFSLPGLPRTTNASHVHWAIKSKHNKKWKEAVYWRAHKLGLPVKPLASAKLTLTRFSAKEPDFDGLVSSFKPLIDGLTKAGVILDDKQSVIGQPRYLWQFAKMREGRVTILVESVDVDLKSA